LQPSRGVGYYIVCYQLVLEDVTLACATLTSVTLNTFAVLAVRSFRHCGYSLCSVHWKTVKNTLNSELQLVDSHSGTEHTNLAPNIPVPCSEFHCITFSTSPCQLFGTTHRPSLCKRCVSLCMPSLRQAPLSTAGERKMFVLFISWQQYLK
jgi:hypothetical protein